MCTNIEVMKKDVSDNGVKFLKNEEGFVRKAYKDAVGLWTIGVGTLIDTPEEQYLLKKILTDAEVEKLLQSELDVYEAAVAKLVKLPINQNQFDAIVSLVFNIGIGAFQKSSLLKKVNLNPNDTRLIKVADVKPLDAWLHGTLIKEKKEFINTIELSFLLWNKAGGKPILYGRRKREAKLYKTTII